MRPALLLLLAAGRLSSVGGFLYEGVRVGAVLAEQRELGSSVFQFAVNHVNNLSPGSNRWHYTFYKGVMAVGDEASDEFFHYRKGVCELISLREDGFLGPGVAAIIGSLPSRHMQLVETMCSRFRIPLIRIDEDSTETNEEFEREGVPNISLNLHPTVEDLGMAMIHFIQAFGWKSFAVLHDSNQVWRKQKNVFDELFSGLREDDYEVSVYKFDGRSYRPVLKALKEAGDQKRRFIVDVSTDNIGYFLQTAKELDMLTDNRHYMFTSLDLAALDVSRYCEGGVNVTGYSLVNATSAEALRHMKRWTDERRGKWSEQRMPAHRHQQEMATRLLQTNLALIIDATHVFANACSAARRKNTISTAQLRCSSDDDYWIQGSSFYDTLRSGTYRGMSGDIRFDKYGRRVDVKLGLVGFDVDGQIEEIGHWTATKGLIITKSAERRYQEVRKELGDRPLRVVVKKEEPFVMESPNEKRNGHTVYRGYCIDLLEKLSSYLNFTYKIHVVRDGKTGNIENDTWNGMIGELVRGEADLAVASLTITTERLSAVDFTAPFMTLGIGILFKKPSPKEPDMFSFLLPLHFEIWICVIGAMIAFALTIFLFARFGPYEWKNTHPCHPEVRIIENEFTFMNSVWFVVASFLQQGSEETPKSSSLRVLAGVWSFFCMIMVSSYTANLAAFLTVSRMSAPIESARDLSKQTTIKYGCYPGGATQRFFEKSTISVYQAMWNFMEAYKSDVMLDTDDGVNRVLKGDYAYLMESVPLRYQLTQHCDLMEVGQELDSKFYGLGLPKGSPYTDLFSEALVNLSDDQVLAGLYNKWWKVEDPPCGSNNEKADIISQRQLGVTNFAGLYLFLTVGVALSFVVGIAEFFIVNIVAAKENKVSACSQICDDCSFAVRCCSRHKKFDVNAGEAEEALTNGTRGAAPRGSASTAATTRAAKVAAPTEKRRSRAR